MTRPSAFHTDQQNEESDAALLRTLIQGNEEALLLLHRRYASRLLALAKHTGLADPEQAVEEVFVLMYRSPHCFVRSELEANVWIVGLASWHFRRSQAPAQPSSSSI